MNRYNLTHQPREYLTHNIWRGQRFFLTTKDFPMRYMYPEIIEVDFVEDELVLYYAIKPYKKEHRNSINITTLEQYYTLHDGTPYDEGLRG